MSDDLISRKALYETINSQDEEISLIDVLATIEEFPTAYDVDKVIEQLMETKCSDHDANTDLQCYIRNEHISMCIDIVKGGGIDG